MKDKLLIINLLIIFSGIEFGFSQSLPVRNSTVPLQENVKAFAAKCNQKLFGKNVFVFDPSMEMHEVQTLIDSIYSGQLFPQNEFSENRYAFLFKPGTYQLDVKVGYYMQIMGLGNSPEDVVIVGAVRSSSNQGGHVLCNFWRAAENLTIVPTKDSTNTWAVSQASPLRRIHIKGNLKLFEGASSGGFMSDCKIDGTVFSGSQQQWITRNSVFKKWNGGVWNMVYVGVTNAPVENWPDKPVTVVNETPEVREKPFLVYSGGNYSLIIPSLKKNSCGVDWDKPNIGRKKVSMSDFYITIPENDNSRSINKALKKGKNVLFTPGIYFLEESLKVTNPGTILIGIGMATLVPQNGNKVIEVSDVNGVTIAGLLVDASKASSEVLMQLGEPGSHTNHSMDPTFLFDLFFRVGGPHDGSSSQCLVINSNNAYGDHIWLWRADHGTGVGWDKNRSANGLIVNGDNVTFYGLFNEHFQEYQTIWNGAKGRVYFYQSEMPYDPPTADAWKHGKTFGYASYKVADQVKEHWAWGVGIYNVFYNAPVIVDQAMETPEQIESTIHHKVIFWLNGNKESTVRSIINGKGGSVNSTVRKQTME